MSPEDEQPDSTWERLTVFSGIHRLSSGCSRLCSLGAGGTTSSQNTRKLQCAGRNSQEAISLQALCLCQLLIILQENLWREDYRPGEGRVHRGAGIMDEWMSWRRFLVSKCPRSLTMSEVRRLLNWPFWGKLPEASNTGLETRKADDLPAHVARKHGSLAQAIVKLKNPLQAGLRKRKEHLALEQDGVWGQAWCEPAELLPSVLKATQVFVVHLTHGAFTCYTFFPVSTFRCSHHLPQEARRHTRNSKERLCLYTTEAHVGHEHSDWPRIWHKPGLPTGGKLLPIMKLSPRFGSCIFSCTQRNLPSFHQKSGANWFLSSFQLLSCRTVHALTHPYAAELKYNEKQKSEDNLWTTA